MCYTLAFSVFSDVFGSSWCTQYIRVFQVVRSSDVAQSNLRNDEKETKKRSKTLETKSPQGQAAYTVSPAFHTVGCGAPWQDVAVAKLPPVVAPLAAERADALGAPAATLLRAFAARHSDLFFTTGALVATCRSHIA